MIQATLIEDFQKVLKDSTAYTYTRIASEIEKVRKAVHANMIKISVLQNLDTRAGLENSWGKSTISPWPKISIGLENLE